MKQAFDDDTKAILEGSMAYHRVLVLNRMEEDLRTLEIKKMFMFYGGLEVLHKLLRPTDDKKIEPCLAVKIKVLQIIEQMNLTPDEVAEHGAILYSAISHNRNRSQIPELRELCTLILRNWDFVMYRELNLKGRNNE